MRKKLFAAICAALVAGCAPDSMSSMKATGFNAFVDRVAVECAPLQVGEMLITPNYQVPNYALNDYDQWFDQTSRLYYKRISPQTYVNNIGNFFPGERTARSTQCLVSKLPPPEARPNAPAGRW